MKSFNSLFVCAFAGICICVASCSKTNSSIPAAQSTGSDSITGILTSGSWIISSITQQKEDNTGSFTGYTFRFLADGKLGMSKNGTTLQGSWHYAPAVTYYGSSSKNVLSISAGTDNPFRRLSKTWNLASATTTRIALDNPETVEDEHLQFQKQ